MTRRKEIEKLLSKQAMSIKEIADYFGVDVPDIVEDLRHVKRSIQPPRKFIFQPAQCTWCGFQFKEREKLKPPTKCPRCRKEGIDEATYSIK